MAHTIPGPDASRRPTAAIAAPARRGLWQRVAEHRILYLMFLPVIAYYVIFRYWPIVLAWIVAFKDLQLGAGVFSSEWVGFANFRVLFQDPEIVNVLRNTVEISLLRIVVGFFPPIVLAIMFHDLASRRWKKWLQSAVYIPHFFSWVIVYGIVFAFFSTGTGFVNNVLDGSATPGSNFSSRNRGFARFCSAPRCGRKSAGARSFTSRR